MRHHFTTLLLTTLALATLGIFAAPPAGAQKLDYSNGFSGSGIQTNGSASIVNGALQLTDGGFSEAGSAFSTRMVNASHFTTVFTFQIQPGQSGYSIADGLTFTLQAATPTALGADGGSLGYGPDINGNGAITPSVAVKFDTIDNINGDSNSLTGLYTDGAAPSGQDPLTGSLESDLFYGYFNNPVQVLLGNTGTFTATMSYDGSILSVTITDDQYGTTVGQAYGTLLKPLNIPAILGSQTAYVGFTGGTGGLASVQSVTNWVFQSNALPVAQNQSLTLNTGMLITPITLKATDSDGDPLSYKLLSLPIHGVLAGTLPNLVYARLPKVTGTDSFQFQASDGQTDSNIATVTITLK